MFTVRVAARVQPDSRDTFVAQLKREEREVPARFAGCARFAVYADPADADNLFIYEEWQSAEHFDAYRTSEYFAASGEVLFPLIAGAPDSAYYEAELVGP